MNRRAERSLNRAVARAVAGKSVNPLEARDAALGLLARSVRFGHVRLAVRRLALAVQLDVDVPSAYWRYCCEVVETSADNRLRERFLQLATSCQESRQSTAPT